VITAAADVRDAAQVESFLEATVACWGRINVILSNAGDPGHIAPVTEYPEDAFDRTMSIHARGAFLVCKYGLSQMNDGGSIIITSSVVGVRGGTGINLGYAAAKHAQVGVMRAAARFAAARGIRVNTLNPGAIDKAFQTGIEDRMGKLSGVNVTDQLNQTIPIKAMRGPTRSPARRSISLRTASATTRDRSGPSPGPSQANALVLTGQAAKPRGCDCI
jgi:NAD(P)-dependent dehydrogenase (short-subunit alcohol dehydrogenase family)